MQAASLAWGILALSSFLTDIFPYLGWVNLPISSCGLLFSLVALAIGRPGERAAAKWGVALCAIAVLVASRQYMVGG